MTFTPVTSTQAWADYSAAAADAGVTVRMVTASDAWSAAALLEQIWGAKPIEAPMLIALASTGAYAVVASDGDDVLGAAAGYFCQPLGTALHSHVAGVRPGITRPGIGRVMKLHQRAWCLDLGVTEVTWTYDPLVSRNAHINIQRLGVDVDKYVTDYYGVMTDGLNVGQGSDRALVRWHLDRDYLPSEVDPRVAAVRDSAVAILIVMADGAPAAQPVPASATAVTLAIPRDIEELRKTDPAQASSWRSALRNAMVPMLADGWRVTGFEPATGYFVERA